MIETRICIHICFFYIESRLDYIRRIFEETNKYHYTADIFIHTNVYKAIPPEILNLYNNGNITIMVHDLTGENPFYLAWKCRDLMKLQKNDYDIFMYIEDDILVPAAAIKYWEKYRAKIPANWNLGFLRIEVDEKNDEYVTDLRRKIHETIRDEQNQVYFINSENPYCAFWIYDKETFSKWTENDLYDIPNIRGYEIRESSAIGLHGLWTNWYSCTVLPLDEFIEKNIHSDCRIYHMPNNYIGSGEFAKYLFTEIVDV